MMNEKQATEFDFENDFQKLSVQYDANPELPTKMIDPVQIIRMSNSK